MHFFMAHLSKPSNDVSDIRRPSDLKFMMQTAQTVFASQANRLAKSLSQYKFCRSHLPFSFLSIPVNMPDTYNFTVSGGTIQIVSTVLFFLLTCFLIVSLLVLGSSRFVLLATVFTFAARASAFYLDIFGHTGSLSSSTQCSQVSPVRI